MKHKMLLFPILFLIITGFTACSPKVSPTSTASITPAPSYTPNPSKTPLPSVTPSALATRTKTAIPDTPPPPTSTLEIDPKEISLYTQGFLPHFNYFFVFEFPKEITGQYYAMVDINKEYTCNTFSKHRERLYCWGQLVRVLDYTQVALYAKGMSEPLYDERVFIPDFGQ